MRAVSYHNVTRGTGHRCEDNASCEAPCKDENEAGGESSGANKAQTVGEATEATCDVWVEGGLTREGTGTFIVVKAARMLGEALSGGRFRAPFHLISLH
jgi:hypothetical protein